MRFNFTDAWILHSIHFSELDNLAAELRKIISYADYVNHAIITYPEFVQSILKLVSIGIVKQQNKTLTTTRVYKQWWDSQYSEKKSMPVLEIIHHVEQYLNLNFKNSDLSASINKIQITEQEFTKAVDIYLNH
jgi:hypothetical protein